MEARRLVTGGGGESATEVLLIRCTSSDITPRFESCGHLSLVGRSPRSVTNVECIIPASLRLALKDHRLSSQLHEFLSTRPSVH
jgi:hypothetical protein